MSNLVQYRDDFPGNPFAALSKGLWKTPLDFNVCFSFKGELCLPFARFISQTKGSLADTIFTKFCELPIELQLRAFKFCDGPLLFQLMQTSSLLRAEAIKLFQSLPEARYYVDYDWLQSGGHPGDADHDMSFSTHVKTLQVGIGFHGYFSELREETWVRRLVDGKVTDQHVQDLWRTLQQPFPHVNQVILNDHCETLSDPTPPEYLIKVAQLCPHHISVRLSALLRIQLIDNDCGLERLTWRKVDGWEECIKPSELEIILPQKISTGTYRRIPDLLPETQKGCQSRCYKKGAPHSSQGKAPFRWTARTFSLPHAGLQTLDHET